MTRLVQNVPAIDRLQPARDAFRAVLLHVQPEAAAQPRLATAVALARMLDATLIGVGAEISQPIGFGGPMEGADALWMMTWQVQDDLRRAEEVFRTSSAGLRAEWSAAEEIPVAAVAKLSRGADLIVAGGSPYKGNDRYRWCNPAELILRSGRPVLLVPPSGGTLAAEAVIVAWKDTREARRALADAMPFLQSAREVVVVEVCAEDQFGAAESRTVSVVQGLERHGVEARSKVVVGSPDQIAAELDIAAGVAGADLVVAGGYGHSRLGEWVFGGVTRDLLQGLERFLLMSH